MGPEPLVRSQEEVAPGTRSWEDRATFQSDRRYRRGESAVKSPLYLTNKGRGTKQGVKAGVNGLVEVGTSIGNKVVDLVKEAEKTFTDRE